MELPNSEVPLIPKVWGRKIEIRFNELLAYALIQFR